MLFVAQDSSSVVVLGSQKMGCPKWSGLSRSPDLSLYHCTGHLSLSQPTNSLSICCSSLSSLLTFKVQLESNQWAGLTDGLMWRSSQEFCPITLHCFFMVLYLWNVLLFIVCLCLSLPPAPPYHTGYKLLSELYVYLKSLNSFISTQFLSQYLLSGYMDG